MMKCEICNSENVKFLYKLRDRLYNIDNKMFNLFGCKSCGLLFINPKPSEKELSKYYPENYISKISKKDPRNNLIDLLYRTYFEKGRLPLKILFLPVKNLLRFLPKQGRVLDVGCGDGKFLRYCKNNGLEVSGVDLYIEKPIPELNIKKSDLLSTKFPNKSFDCITLNNVIEHVQNPEEILRECKRILKDNGRLVLNFPSPSSFNYRVFGKDWVSMDTPRHLFLFSIKSIKLLLKRNNMKITKISNKAEAFSLIGSYIYKKGGDDLDKSKILSNSLINIALMPLAMILNALGLGDSKEIIIKKEFIS